MPDKLDCPACGVPGGSPVGCISWVCENTECNVETFRVIDHDLPENIGLDTVGGGTDV